MNKPRLTLGEQLHRLKWAAELDATSKTGGRGSEKTGSLKRTPPTNAQIINVHFSEK